MESINSQLSLEDLEEACSNLEGLDLSFEIEGLQIREFTIKPVLDVQTSWLKCEEPDAGLKLFVVLSGCLQVTIGEERFDVTAGDSFMACKGLRPSLCNMHSRPLSLYIVTIDIDAWENEISEARMITDAFKAGNHMLLLNSEMIPCLCEKIISEAKGLDLGYKIVIKRVILIMLLSIFRIVAKDEICKGYDLEPVNKSVPPIYKLLKYIKDNAKKSITIEDIANSLYISKRHIYRIIKAEIGLTVRECIIHMKQYIAKKMLRATCIPVEKIAEEFGYSSSEHFIKEFKKVQGICPAQYRKLRRGSEDQLMKYTDFELDWLHFRIRELNTNILTDNFVIDLLRFVPTYRNEPMNYESPGHIAFEIVAHQYGKCKMVFESTSMELKAGEFCLIAPGIRHSYLKEGNESMIYFELKFLISLLKDIPCEEQKIIKTFNEAPLIPFKHGEHISDLLYRILHEAEAEPMGCLINIRSYITLIIIYFARAIRSVKSASEDFVAHIDASKEEDQRVGMIRTFLESNTANFITVKDIAAYLSMSVRQVNYFLMKSKGVTVKGYIDDFKLRKAKVLLKKKEQTIKSISKLLGFSNEYYFSKFFKHKEGHPPKVFRGEI